MLSHTNLLLLNYVLSLSRSTCLQSSIVETARHSNGCHSRQHTAASSAAIERRGLMISDESKRQWLVAVMIIRLLISTGIVRMTTSVFVLRRLKNTHTTHTHTCTHTYTHTHLHTHTDTYTYTQTHTHTN